MQNTHSIDFESGSSQSAEIADGSQTGLDITGDISLEIYIKRESAIEGGLITKYDYGNNRRGYSLKIDGSNKIDATFSDDGVNVAGHFVTQTSDSAVLVPTATWVHVGVTFDISTEVAIIYIDGSPVASSKTGSMGATIFDSDMKFRIGGFSFNDAVGLPFDGLLNNARVWSGVRTPAEMLANYQKIITSGPAGSWYAIGDHVDLTSNNNDLTAVGSPSFSTDVPFVVAADSNFFPLL
jgi:hypothetical protein